MHFAACTAGEVFGVDDFSFGSEDMPQMAKILEVRLAKDVSDGQYTENTAVVAPESLVGWDIVVCSRNGYCHFENVKISIPRSFDTMPDRSITRRNSEILLGNIWNRN